MNSFTFAALKMLYSLASSVCFLILLSGINESNGEEICRRNEKSLTLLDMAAEFIAEAKSHFPINPDNSTASNYFDYGDAVKSLTYIECTQKLIERAKENLTASTDCRDRPRDCSEVLANGYNGSGVYTIYPISRITVAKSVDVYCDMATDGGGWTVIQRRGYFPPQQDFNQGWRKYKSGFGDINGEFWLGNDYIYALCNQRPCQIRFDLQDVKGNRRFAVYNSFWIQDEDSDYAMSVSGYRGDAGDAFKHYDGVKFSTIDRGYTGAAEFLKGAFWHLKDWAYVHLNGVYQPGKDEPQSIHWWEWLENEGLAYTEMKLRLR